MKIFFENLFIFLSSSLFLFGSLFGIEYSCQEREERLMDDLMITEYWNCRICERFPIYYNHLLQGGYINMPSARMGNEGELSLGYSYVPPYHNWNARAQVLDRLELTLNYRIFKGVKDPVLSEFGFGDFSDKGANLKFAILRPEDSDYELPGFAVGLDDFLGTRSFKSRYIVATQVFPRYNCELSLGWGEWRIRGIFGGIIWAPFWNRPNSFLSGLAFSAEYDAIPYESEKREPHPGGRVKKSPINIGIKYALGNAIELSASRIRGTEYAFSGSLAYNFGSSKGFVSKTSDPLPYSSPVNTEPLGYFRSEEVLVQDLNFAFMEQGLELMEVWLGYDNEGAKTLYMNVYNKIYRFENKLRERLDRLLAYLIPADIKKVNVIIMSEGFPIQQYNYCMYFVRRLGAGCMGRHELEVLTPISEVKKPDPYLYSLLFKQDFYRMCFVLFPDFRSYFGSAKGKFKYTLGFNTGIDGYLPYEIFYSFRAGYLVLSDIDDVNAVDRLNPSQIINVKTDLPLYLKQRGLVFPEFYLRKINNWGSGVYTKFAVGYFEQSYGGCAYEFLYYPVCSRWAFGIEGAVLKKRNHTGFGFTDKIRKFHGFIPTYRKFLGSQYFANLYYDCREINMEFRIKAGQFLARDLGVRYEISKYFESGMRLTGWYTMTNGRDKINNETYYDKGFMITLPLDIFYTCSSRRQWRYGMSAWLRDVGFYSTTGGELYYLINDQRQR